MKAVYRITFIVAFLVVAAATTLQAQRIITGTVYKNGEPAAGITVEAHRGKSMMTSFDGKYKVEADDRTKWLKFTFLDDSKRLDISEKSGNEFDFAFEGELPTGEEDADGSGEVILKSMDELIKEQDREFMNLLSLYTEFFKQGNYDSALPHWKNLYTKYPKSTLDTYIRGAIMYEHYIENATTPEQKANYIEDLMKLYDKRIRYFNEKGYVLGRKATSWLKYKLDDQGSLNNDELAEILKKGYGWINESISERGDETELPVLVLLMQTTSSLFKQGELPKETVVKNYDTANKILEHIKENSESDEKVANANKVQVYIEDIFGSSGAADCEALVTIFTPQYEQNKNDTEFLKSMLGRLSRTDCDQSTLFSEATEQLYQLEPSAEAAYNMARRYVRQDDTERAKKYYQDALEQETDEAMLAKYYYEYALFIFAKENALQEARSYARQALDLNPKYCEAMMLIGDIYVAASRNFGEDDFQKSSVFWIAVDYYDRARAHPDCAVEAAKKANDFRKYFPNNEEAFFRGLKEGQNYTVGGWINETTKVRF